MGYTTAKHWMNIHLYPGRYSACSRTPEKGT